MYGKVKKGKLNLRQINLRLILYVVLLSIIGILMVHSATANEVTTSIVSTTVKQIVGVVAGIVLLGGAVFVDYRKVVRWAWVIYILAIGGLLYVLFFTNAISGARRWIYFPFFGTVQPSEFAKPAMILFLAMIAFFLEEKLTKIWGIGLFLLGAAPVLVLVLKEPDLSTSIVLILIVVTMLFLSGISYKWVVGVLALAVPFVILFLVAVYQEDQIILNAVFKPHQVTRINGYFFPENYPSAVYQQKNSLMAIGSGGFFGKGLNNTSLESVKNGNFLAEEQCDFIFSVIGEELGFFGALCVLVLLALVVFECFKTAEKCTDTVGKLIAAACGASLGFQSLINVGVAILLIPNTGIPLPFISAGLSSLLSSYILIALVLSVGLYGNRKKKVYYQ